jgi:hypothetical protein
MAAVALVDLLLRLAMAKESTSKVIIIFKIQMAGVSHCPI